MYDCRAFLRILSTTLLFVFARDRYEESSTRGYDDKRLKRNLISLQPLVSFPKVAQGGKDARGLCLNITFIQLLQTGRSKRRWTFYRVYEFATEWLKLAQET